MKKMIINYDGDPMNALAYVGEVIKMGRISGDGTTYCYASRFNDGALVHADLTNRGTDTFRIMTEAN